MLAPRAEELKSQSDAMRRQSEDLRRQGEKFKQQGEEMRRQGEDARKQLDLWRRQNPEMFKDGRNFSFYFGGGRRIHSVVVAMPIDPP